MVVTSGLPCLPGPSLSLVTSTPTAVPPLQSMEPVQELMLKHMYPKVPPRMAAR